MASKIFFLLNPSHPRKMGIYRELAERSARRHGWEARFGSVDRDHAGDTEFLLGQMVEEKCSRLVILGGDGTLHRAVNGLHRLGGLASTEIAVVPGGTCNDLARALGLRRRRLADALETACSGKAREVDLAHSGEELFINNAGFGRRSAGPRRGRPRSLKTLRSFCPTPLRARWEAGALEGTFFMALACNAPFFSGGLCFSKTVRIHDGLLDIFLVPAMPQWKMISLLLKGRLGRPIFFRSMITLRVRAIEFESQTDLWPQADGEPCLGAVRRVGYAIAPEKAMIVTPAQSKSIGVL